MEPCATICFPPTPIYITAGVLAAMVTTVASKVGGVSNDEGGISEGAVGLYRGFSTFLIGLATIPFLQLTVILAVNACSNLCGEHQLVLWLHFFTILPLLVGLSYWVTRLVGVRLRNPLRFD